MRKKSLLTELFLSAALIGSSLGLTSDLQAQSNSINQTPTASSPQDHPIISLPIVSSDIDRTLKKIGIDPKEVGPTFKNTMQHFRFSPNRKERKQEIENIRQLTTLDFSPATFTHEIVHSNLSRAFKSFAPKEEYMLQFTSQRGRKLSINGWECILKDCGDDKEGTAAQVTFIKSPRDITFAQVDQHIPYFIKSTYTYTGKFKNIMDREEREDIPQRTAILINELSAYATHGQVALEDHDKHPYYQKLAEAQRKKIHGVTTAVGETETVAEIIFCALALIHEIERNPTAYENNSDKQHFYDVTGDLIKKCIAVYQQGLDQQKYPQLSNDHNSHWSQDYIGVLLTHPASNHLKSALEKVCGKNYTTTLAQQNKDVLAKIMNAKKPTALASTPPPHNTNQRKNINTPQIAKSNPPPYQTNGTPIHQHTATYSSNGIAQYPSPNIIIQNPQGIVINNPIPTISSGVIINSHPVPHQGFVQTIGSSNFTPNQAHFNTASSYPIISIPSAPITQHQTYSATITNQSIPQSYSAIPTYYPSGY